MRVHCTHAGVGYRVHYTAKDRAFLLHCSFLRTMREMGWWMGRPRAQAERMSHDMKSTTAHGAWGRLRCRVSANSHSSIVEFYEGSLDQRWSDEVTADSLRRFRRTAAVLTANLRDRGYADASPPVWRSVLSSIDYRCRTNGHYRGEPSLFDARTMSMKVNARDRDGNQLRNGQVRYYYGPHGNGGALRRGRVFHSLNNMWFVVSGNEAVIMAAHRLFCWRDGMPRRNTRRHGRRILRSMIRQALDVWAFEYASVLRDAYRRLEARDGR